MHGKPRHSAQQSHVLIYILYPPSPSLFTIDHMGADDRKGILIFSDRKGTTPRREKIYEISQVSEVDDGFPSNTVVSSEGTRAVEQTGFRELGLNSWLCGNIASMGIVHRNTGTTGLHTCNFSRKRRHRSRANRYRKDGCLCSPHFTDARTRTLRNLLPLHYTNQRTCISDLGTVYRIFFRYDPPL